MLSCAGNPWVKTPNLDSIAANGVRFERTYVTNPVCSPSRMSLMTGRMPSAIGMECNEDLRRPVKVTAAMLDSSLGMTFRKAGYQTMFGGKTHLPETERGEGELGEYGFDLLTRDQRDELANVLRRFSESEARPPVPDGGVVHQSARHLLHGDQRLRAGAGPEGARARKAAVPRNFWPRRCSVRTGFRKRSSSSRYCPPLPANYEPAKDELSAVMLDKRDFQKYVREKWTDQDWRMHRWAYARLTEQVDARDRRGAEGAAGKRPRERHAGFHDHRSWRPGRIAPAGA